MSKPPAEKTILIVEDHPVFRQGLRSIIDSDADRAYRVVGEAVTARDGFKLVGDLGPDLALIDISLPGTENGIMLAGKIADRHPATRVLIISMHSKIDYISEAFKAGAGGYLSKDSASEELLDAMAMVLAGKEYLDPNLSPSIVETLKKIPSQADDSYGSLSEREQEILRLLAGGDSAVEVGKLLKLSPKTIENHRSNIFKKLNFSKYFDLYQYARRIGIIDPD
ncbi:MAG: response regulator transcription factor [Thermodesulfobacteriota bacterium]